MLKRRIASLCAALGVLLVLPANASSGVPSFTVHDIGVGIPMSMNANGVILGQDSYTASLPWVWQAGAKTYLPLPADTTSVTVARISDTGVVVGQVNNAPAIWRPGSGGYELLVLPFPAGATIGRAIDVNSSGQVVVTFGTPFTSPTGMVFVTYTPYLYDLSNGNLVDLTTIYVVAESSFPDPVDLTEGGRILLQSGEILEPNGTVTPTPAFPPRPPGGYSWVSFQASHMNEAGAFIGVAGLSSSMGYKQVVKYTPGAGWTVLGGLSGSVFGTGIAASGDALLLANYVCPNNYGLGYAVNGGSTYCLDDLVLDAGWSFLSFASRGVISSTGTVAAYGYSAAAASYRLAILSPAGDLPAPPAVSLTATPHPGTSTQPYDAITLSWTSAGPLAKLYSIERIGPGESQYVEIARIGATVTSYNDQAITPLASYTYRVAAIGLAGAGPYSNLATAKAPPPMDRTSPTATIASPANGATVTGTITVSATFTDNVGVVYASLDYAPNMGLGRICERAPATASTTLTLSCKWDTSKVAYQSPSATLTAYAYDAMGNWTQTSVDVTVTYSAKGGKGRGK